MTRCKEKCGEEMRIMQRCVGYYSDRQSTNKGKLEEIKMRKMMDLAPFKEEEETSSQELQPSSDHTS